MDDVDNKDISGEDAQLLGECECLDSKDFGSYSNSLKEGKCSEESKVFLPSIRFNAFVKVVLIPSRKEIKKAKCDLWWTGEDFYMFQQSAMR
jgi:hypothetical protein